MTSKRFLLICAINLSIFSGLMSMDQKVNCKISIEFHQISDVSDFDRWAGDVLPVYVEAVVAEVTTFLLSDGSKVKPEYQEIIEKICQNKEKREMYDALTALFACSENKKAVVDGLISFYKKKIDAYFTKLRTQKPVLVIAKNSEGVLLGFALFLFGHPGFFQDSVCLELLIVNPNVPKCGIGMHLIFSILRYGLTKIKHIIMTTPVWNTEARKIYSRFGFQEFVTRDPEFVGLEYTVN